MEPIHVYIDESGNSDIETEKIGASKYFIIAAVIVNDDVNDSLQMAIEILRKKHFQTGEIKSSSIKDRDDYKRRCRILSDVSSLDFKFYILAVDKQKIKKDSGLKYKRSFIKFINGKLYSRLFESYSHVTLLADEHGSDEFKKSFIGYMNKEHMPDLFHESSASLDNSKSNVLIQLADFIAGTAAKIYENNIKSGRLFEAYKEFLKSKCLRIDEWPTYFQASYGDTPKSDDYKWFIEPYCVNQAEIYIEKHESKKDRDIIIRVATASYLVFNARWGTAKKYINTKEIIEHLSSLGISDISVHKFRSDIISKLRDANVLIASSTKGYKIPSDLAELSDFVRMIDTNVLPLLKRLQIARDSLLLASKDQIDILHGPDYPHIVDFLEILQKREI